MITKVWSAGRTGAVRAGERLLVRLQVSDYAEVIGLGEDFTNLELGQASLTITGRAPTAFFISADSKRSYKPRFCKCRF